MRIHHAVLQINTDAVASMIAGSLRVQVIEVLRRRGIVVGLSGGVDSAVVAALAARAFGPQNVLAVLMPERDSSPLSLELGKLVADTLAIPYVVEDLGPTLEASLCYERQTEAIRTVFPDYEEGWKCKLTLPSLLGGDRISVSQLTVLAPDGTEQTSRMSATAYRQLVAATNMKQRARKAMEYYHADRLGHAVAGTVNRLEYDQGFFVKQGDGAADVKPIAHLYKTQVYALATLLGIPVEVRSRPPTTDTFSMEQTQEEFYFALPYPQMDLCLWAHEHKVPADDTAHLLDLSVAQVERIFHDIEAKRRSTRYLHLSPLFVDGHRADDGGVA